MLTGQSKLWKGPYGPMACGHSIGRLGDAVEVHLFFVAFCFTGLSPDRSALWFEDAELWSCKVYFTYLYLLK